MIQKLNYWTRKHGSRPLTVFLLSFIVLLIVGCTPSHVIRPYPNSIKAGVQAGDRVKIETTKSEIIEVTIDTVKNDALIAGERHIAFSDILYIEKRSWKEPAHACGDNIPLGCSIPHLIQMLEPVRQHEKVFRPACIQHDFCYRHGHKTYARSREDCDNQFRIQLKQSCAQPKFVSLLTLYTFKTQCLALANQMYQAVRRYGEDKFRIENSSYCEYDGPSENLSN